MNLRPEILALVKNDAARKSAYEGLLATAVSSLEKNLRPIEGKTYLAAGLHQFNSLWTRDFCWSARGLIAIGKEDVVANQIDRLLNDPGVGRPQDTPFLLPRTLDSMSTTKRVIKSTFPRFVSLPLGSPLQAYYLDQNKGIAFDGNFLTVMAADLCRRNPRMAAWWNGNKARLAETLRFYDAKAADGTLRFQRDGLLWQPDFSDWQDSVRRRGHTFYSNMVYACVLQNVVNEPEFGVTPAMIADLRTKIDGAFRDASSKLYVSVKDQRQISLDGNLLAIDLGYLPQDRSKELFQALRSWHPLWPKLPDLPGFVTSPKYPLGQKSLNFVLVTLGDYHDSLYWSWLMALSAKVAAMNPEDGAGAEALAILDRLVSMVQRDGWVAEVFDPRSDLPRHNNLFYHSEEPFSWGAAFVIDALGDPSPGMALDRQ